MVKRYEAALNMGPGDNKLCEHVDGDYVLASDYDDLLAERDLLLAVVGRIESIAGLLPIEIIRALDAYHASKGDSDA